MRRLRRHSGIPLASCIMLAAVSSLLIGLNTDWSSPPRFDGAGYAVLGEALASGRGYREIDRPDAPRHAHFPPGYPAALAVLWHGFGRSAAAAHLFSAACTIAAVLLAGRWYRTLYPPRTAWMLAMALALNWTWGRGGASIQSEPLYAVEELLAVLAAVRAGRRGGVGSGILLGLALAACVLTRHVGVCLIVAAAIDLGLRGRWRTLLAALLTATVLTAPWVVWLARVRRNTQIALLAPQGSGNALAARVAAQALFYLERIPDQITGPFVEVATVFRHAPAIALVANTWAALATCLVIWGWARTLKSPRRRLAGLIGFTTLALLLVWPFTEAGRFLVPLVPVLLVGAAEGLAHALAGRLVPKRRARRWAVLLMLAASVPYTVYSVASGRAAVQRHTHADFDTACQWIAAQGVRPGPVLTRHPGELYWQTGRLALPPDPPDPESIQRLIARHGVPYMVIDDDRFANSGPNPLGRYVEQFPDRVRRVGNESRSGTTVRVFEVTTGDGIAGHGAAH